MLIGRDYRKSISQMWAQIAFRWLAVWLIIAYCASQGSIWVAAGLVVVAIDLIGYSSARAMVLVVNNQATKDWMDRLTNRIFYKLLVEEVQAGRGSHLDVDELFRRASKDAVADMNRADADSKMLAGFMDTTAWHVCGGILSFLGTVVSSTLYYGSALLIASSNRGF